MVLFYRDIEAATSCLLVFGYDVLVLVGDNVAAVKRRNGNRALAIDLLNFVFLRDCPSLASQSSNFDITCGTFPAFLCFPASFDIQNANIIVHTGTTNYYTRFDIRNANIIVHTGTTTPGLYVPSDTTLLDHMHAQLRSIRLYMAQQRSVAPCGAVRSHAVRCGALRCGAVSLRCVLSFEHRALPGIMRVLCTEYYFSSFFFFFRLRVCI